MNSVLVTGGTGKLGKQFVDGFLRQGWHVYFTSTSQGKIDSLYAKYPQFEQGKKLNGLKVKLDSIEEVHKLIRALKNANLTSIVNNARSLDSLKIEDDGFTKAEMFQKEFFMATVVPYELIKAFKSDLSTMVNISSMYSVVAPNAELYDSDYSKSPVQYGVAKAAQNHLTKELAVRFANENIRVNSLSYGGFEGRVDEHFLAKYKKLCPLKRMLKEEEAFEHLFYLASERSSGMTGHNLVVDGGWSVW